MRKVYILSFLIVFLSGCSSEYMNNKAICKQQAISLFPVNNMLTNVTKYKDVKVPTGNSTCNSFVIGNMINTDCQQIYTTEKQSYTEIEMIDVNEKQRNDMINSCVASACYKTHKNHFCW